MPASSSFFCACSVSCLNVSSCVSLAPLIISPIDIPLSCKSLVIMLDCSGISVLGIKSRLLSRCLLILVLSILPLACSSSKSITFFADLGGSLAKRFCNECISLTIMIGFLPRKLATSSVMLASDGFKLPGSFLYISMIALGICAYCLYLLCALASGVAKVSIAPPFSVPLVP